MIRSPMSPEDAAEALALRKAGKTSEEIIEWLGCTLAQLTAVIVAEQIRERRTPPPPKEPAEPPCRLPFGGWPKAMFRVELIGCADLAEAAFELALASRMRHVGMVATFGGIDVMAWPHQTVVEIIRHHERLRGLVRSNLCKLPSVGLETRWTVARKLGVLVMVRDGLMDREVALSAFEISEEELSSWERLLREGGPDALGATKLQQVAA